MMKKIAVPLAVLFASAVYLAVYLQNSPVRAQGSGGALVVATCGTLGQAFAVGSTRSMTVNVNGQVCQ